MNRLPHYLHDVLGLPPASQRKPLLLFLHGLGECGQDLALVRSHGPPKLFPTLDLDRFIVLSPQCPVAPWNEAHLEEFITAAIRMYPVDEQRVYLTGVSMGGVGAWNLATRCPAIFAAVAPVCGTGDPGRANALVNPRVRPIWLFHSAADDVMPVAGSDALFHSLGQARADVTYTRYRSLDHAQTWERAYGSPMLYHWFLRQ